LEAEKFLNNGRLASSRLMGLIQHFGLQKNR